MLGETRFAQALGLIYDVAISSERWPDLLRQLGEDFHCRYVGMARSNQDRSRYEGVAYGLGYHEHQEFLRRFHQRGPLRVLAPLPTAAG